LSLALRPNLVALALQFRQAWALALTLVLEIWPWWPWSKSLGQNLAGLASGRPAKFTSYFSWVNISRLCMAMNHHGIQSEAQVKLCIYM